MAMLRLGFQPVLNTKAIYELMFYSGNDDYDDD